MNINKLIKIIKKSNPKKINFNKNKFKIINLI